MQVRAIGFCDKKIGSMVSLTEQLAEESRKPVVKKIRRRKVYERFQNNIWRADLADMWSLKSFNIYYVS